MALQRVFALADVASFLPLWDLSTAEQVCRSIRGSSIYFSNFTVRRDDALVLVKLRRDIRIAHALFHRSAQQWVGAIMDLENGAEDELRSGIIDVDHINQLVEAEDFQRCCHNLLCWTLYSRHKADLENTLSDLRANFQRVAARGLGHDSVLCMAPDARSDRFPCLGIHDVMVDTAQFGYDDLLVPARCWEYFHIHLKHALEVLRYILRSL